jgi:hypothetical protein
MKHHRKYYVEQAAKQGVDSHVAYRQLKEVQPYSYQNAAHGTRQVLTEKTFQQWIDEYKAHYVHKTHNKTYKDGQRIGKP